MTFNIASFITQLAMLVLALGVLHKPLGVYMARVYSAPTAPTPAAGDLGAPGAPRSPASRVTRSGKLTGLGYRLAGISPDAEQSWGVYLRSVIAFSTVSVLVVFVLQRLQAVLPGSNGLAGVDPWVAMNTAISFVANTNWQSYAPEATVGIFVQMCLLAVQNFLSAAVGMAVVVALIRGFTRKDTDRLGNFWVDLARGAFRILLPIAVVGAVVLMIGGVVQNFWSTEVINQATGVSQTIPGGPVASQEVIKVLGTNGGGYFNANSAHPLENPNAFISLFQVFLILLIPSALPYTFGRMVGSQKQGFTIAAVMGGLWLASNVALGAVLASSPGLGEGFEQRLGPVSSSIFASATTLTSTGAVNVAHDSLPPLAGGMVLVNMMLGEVAPGGVGSGLYGMLLLAIIAVFIAGLMVGRTPEYLGKKIGPTQMKLAAMYILVTPSLVLVFTGITALFPDLMAGAPAASGQATNPHQFTEVLYAFTSGANNNGSAFGGITSSGPYFATMIGLAMWLGRLLPMALVLALAGSLARQKPVPESAGTVPTHGALFVSLLGMVTVILTALSYFPALALGPLAEGLTR